MAIEKKITVDGKPVSFRASAAVPRIYRAKFGKDLFRDMSLLVSQVEKRTDGSLPVESLETFENIAYVMAKHADKTIPDSVEEWLDGFDVFSVYQVLPEIVDLWGLNTKTDVEAKKKNARRLVK